MNFFLEVFIQYETFWIFKKLLIYNFNYKIHIKVDENWVLGHTGRGTQIVTPLLEWGGVKNWVPRPVMLQSPILCKSFPKKLSFAERLNSHFMVIYWMLMQFPIYSSSICTCGGIAQSPNFNYLKFSFNFC